MTTHRTRLDPFENRSFVGDAEAERLVRFALDRLELRRVAVRIIDARRREAGHDGGGYGGIACDLRQHRGFRWQGRVRLAMRLSVTEDWDGYGLPRVDWHSTQMRALVPRGGLPKDPAARTAAWQERLDAAYRHVGALYESGARRLGPWPIYVANDWREAFVHLAAHEARHLLQFDRGRPASEVDCEEYAEFVLGEWRHAEAVRALAPLRAHVEAARVRALSPDEHDGDWIKLAGAR